MRRWATNSLLQEFQTYCFRFVTSHFHGYGGEHTTGFATRNSQWNANISTETHTTTLQGGIHCQMYRIVTFTGIVFMDYWAVIGNFVTGSPPAYKSTRRKIRCLIYTYILRLNQIEVMFTYPQHFHWDSLCDSNHTNPKHSLIQLPPDRRVPCVAHRSNSSLRLRLCQQSLVCKKKQ